MDISETLSTDNNTSIVIFKLHQPTVFISNTDHVIKWFPKQPVKLDILKFYQDVPVTVQHNAPWATMWLLPQLS